MKRKLIPIYCTNLDCHREYPVGTTLEQIAKEGDYNLEYPIVGAIVNNKLKELTYEIYKPKNVSFIDVTNTEGRRMYIRSLQFLLYKAIKDLFPKTTFHVENPVSNGIYCRVNGHNSFLSEIDIAQIKGHMQELVSQDLPFVHEEIETEKAIAQYESQGLHYKSDLLRTRGYIYTSVYHLGETVDYYYGYLVPSTAYLQTFDLVPFHKGMLLRLPDRDNPKVVDAIVKQEKMLQIFSEFNRWGKILHVNHIGDLNRNVTNGGVSDLIKISEALHEKKVAQIADSIRKRRKTIRVILISGPSSSGKTSFAKRLAIQLMVNGLNPVKISLDNYFVNREDNPVDENGEYDFEALEAIDINLFNANLLALMDGQKVELPKFSFETGRRFFDGEQLRIKKKDILIVEGIHALNPKLTPLLQPQSVFKIYVSALTSISIDGHNLIPTTDNRLARRIIRDHKYRNYSAYETIKRWESVRSGEERNIFPFQEEADVMFNSALLYELGVLKRYAEPLLKEVQPNVPEYAEAMRLLKFFSYFLPIPDEEIPPTSLIREFLGGSSFIYD